jgi:hypothetical protein
MEARTPHCGKSAVQMLESDFGTGLNKSKRRKMEILNKLLGRRTIKKSRLRKCPSDKKNREKPSKINNFSDRRANGIA